MWSVLLLVLRPGTLIDYIQHAVDFPPEFNALDLVTDELRTKLASINRRLNEIKTERSRRFEERTRTKGFGKLAARFTESIGQAIQQAFASGSGFAGIYESDGLQAIKEEQEADAEEIRYRDEEKLLLEGLVDQELKNNVGCSESGLYDLVGASFISWCRFHFLPLRVVFICFDH